MTDHEHTMRLGAQIAGALYTHCMESDRWQLHDGAYRMATEDEYRALGEDLYDEDAPIIFTRESDGAFFEVEVDATVWQTTPEKRQGDRDRLTQMQERVRAAEAKRSGAPA